MIEPVKGTYISRLNEHELYHLVLLATKMNEIISEVNRMKKDT